MKKVLVTGAGGSIGVNVIKYLLSEGKYEITIRGIGLIDSEIRVTAGNGEKEIKYNLKKILKFVKEQLKLLD